MSLQAPWKHISRPNTAHPVREGGEAGDIEYRVDVCYMSVGLGYAQIFEVHQLGELGRDGANKGVVFQVQAADLKKVAGPALRMTGELRLCLWRESARSKKVQIAICRGKLRKISGKIGIAIQLAKTAELFTHCASGSGGFILPAVTNCKVDQFLETGKRTLCPGFFAVD